MSRSQIETLASGKSIKDGGGLLLQGPPGAGKTHLAVAMGLRAIETVFSVSSYRLNALMHQLKENAELEPTRLKNGKYMSVNLVILDEFGYQALDREESNLFFRVVNYRYAQGRSIAITTNKGISSWPSVLAGDEVLAGAILDRLLHSATVLSIQGRSYRLKELDAKLGYRSSLESLSGRQPRDPLAASTASPRSDLRNGATRSDPIACFSVR